MTALLGALLLGVVVIIVATRWLTEGRQTRDAPGEPDIDFDELSEAEREVRDLDHSVTPDDADEQLRDWGPGAPK